MYTYIRAYIQYIHINVELISAAGHGTGGIYLPTMASNYFD